MSIKSVLSSTDWGTLNSIYKDSPYSNKNTAVRSFTSYYLWVNQSLPYCLVDITESVNNPLGSVERLKLFWMKHSPHKSVSKITSPSIGLESILKYMKCVNRPGCKCTCLCVNLVLTHLCNRVSKQNNLRTDNALYFGHFAGWKYIHVFLRSSSLFQACGGTLQEFPFCAP